MKKITFSSLLIIATLILASCASTRMGDIDKVEYVNIKTDKDNLNINISYPEFLDFPKLSTAIDKDVAEEWAKMKEEVTDKKREFIVTSEISSSNEVISVLLTFHKTIDGEGTETLIRIENYDTRTGKFLNVLKASGYSLDELSQLTKDALLKPFNSGEIPEGYKDNIDELKQMIEEGTKPIKENFENFTLKDQYIIIYFAPGLVSPVSDGIDFVILPLKEDV